MVVINADRLRQLKPGETVIVTSKKNGKPLKGQGDVSSYITLVSKETGWKFASSRYIIIEQTQPLAFVAVAIKRIS